MAEVTVCSTISCVNALTKFVETGNSLLDHAKTECTEASFEDFTRNKIRIERKESLLGLIEASATLYRSLSVKTKKDAEVLWTRGYECGALKKDLENFLQLGVQWNAFLERLDDGLHPRADTGKLAHQARCISPDTALVDARTGEAVTLQRYLGRGEKVLLVLIRQFSCLFCRLHLKDLQAHQGALEAHSVRVLVISFGCQEGALHWLSETDCPYDMLLDPQRKIYQAFGLRTSLKSVLNFNNMLLYAEYLVAGMEFPTPPSIEDDMFQLGGDFVVDDHGGVLFSHGCQNPIDRPAVKDLLAAL